MSRPFPKESLDEDSSQGPNIDTPSSSSSEDWETCEEFEDDEYVYFLAPNVIVVLVFEVDVEQINDDRYALQDTPSSLQEKVIWR